MSFAKKLVWSKILIKQFKNSSLKNYLHIPMSLWGRYSVPVFNEKYSEGGVDRRGGGDKMP